MDTEYDMFTLLARGASLPTKTYLCGMENIVATVPHAEIKAFMKEGMKKPGPYKTLYLCLAIVAGVAMGALPSYAVTVWIFGDTAVYAVQSGLAILFSLSLLIVIHEWIHGIAYRWNGAKHVYYGGNLKQFVFYAASDGDVFTGRQFRAVAFAPFAVITVSCLLLMLLLPQYLFFFAIVLSLHTLFCGGDFLFVHFLSQYNIDKVRTHDNRAKAESYFYLID